MYAPWKLTWMKIEADAKCQIFTCASLNYVQGYTDDS